MRQTLTSPRGMVTAPHHLAASSASAVLRDGGNAIEAMVAAAATIAVVYPHMNSIGGDGFWIISEPGREPVADRRLRPRRRAGDDRLLPRPRPAGDSRPRAAGRQHRGRRDLGLGRGTHALDAARRQAAAVAPARRCDLVRRERCAGHAKPGQLHHQVPARARAAAGLRDAVPERRRPRARGRHAAHATRRWAARCRPCPTTVWPTSTRAKWPPRSPPNTSAWAVRCGWPTCRRTAPRRCSRCRSRSPARRSTT